MRKIVFALAVVFIFVSCDDDPMEEETVNPFVGTWENEDGGRLVFTETVATSYTSDESVWWSGTYTYNDTHITITTDYRVSGLEDEPNPLVWSYSITNNAMTIGMRSDYRKISN